MLVLLKKKVWRYQRGRKLKKVRKYNGQKKKDKL